MTSLDKSPDWEQLYRELETSLSSIFQSFADILDKHEGSYAQQSAPSIRTVGKYDLDGKTMLICVADGANLEYRFTFATGGRTVLQTEFQRSNSIPLDHRMSEPNCFATVEVRSNNSGAKVITRKVGI